MDEKRTLTDEEYLKIEADVRAYVEQLTDNYMRCWMYVLMPSLVQAAYFALLASRR